MPPVIEKSEASKKAIREKLNQSFMFNKLDEGEQIIVINAMEELTVPAGNTVIREGDEGDCMFVVGNGTLACHKQKPNQKELTFLKTYQPGEAFGELALLYNATRAATIVANEECQLFRLDRGTFNFIVRDSAFDKRNQYGALLKSIDLFSTMEPYERALLCEAFKPLAMKAGESIIREGEDGTDLFLLQEGTAYATKKLDPSKEPQVVMEYKVGDYFGERALLKNEPRAANVICRTDCKLVKMDRHAVKRLLGPLEPILRRNMEIYEKYTAAKPGAP